jgi:hypothetical protein
MGGIIGVVSFIISSHLLKSAELKDSIVALRKRRSLNG